MGTLPRCTKNLAWETDNEIEKKGPTFLGLRQRRAIVQKWSFSIPRHRKGDASSEFPLSHFNRPMDAQESEHPGRH